jgi:hypothetical protein
MIDYFTGWTEAIAIPSKDAVTVSQAIFDAWYTRHGIPYQLQSDQGSEFTNDLIKRLNLRVNTDSHVTTPYYPAPNGKVERFNRTLKNCLKAYAEDEPGVWDRYLNSVLFAYRTSVHPVTGYTPYYLMHGREARLPTDILSGSVTDIADDVDQYGTLITLQLRKAHAIVRGKYEEYAKKTKLSWDKKAPQSTKFSVGELVLMYQPQLNSDTGRLDHSHTFNRKWKGPYRVMEQKQGDHHDVYVIKDETSGREWSINVHKLKQFEPSEFLKSSTDIIHGINNNSASSDAPGKLPDGDVTVDEQLLAPVAESSSPTNPATATVPVQDTVSKTKSYRKSVETKQEQARKKRRLEQPTTKTLEELKSYEIDAILSHRRGRGNKLWYLIRWEQFPEIPDSEIEQKDFNTDEILKDYLTTVQVKERPRQFRSLPYTAQTFPQKEEMGTKLKIKLRMPSKSTDVPPQSTKTHPSPSASKEGGEC